MLKVGLFWYCKICLSVRVKIFVNALDANNFSRNFILIKYNPYTVLLSPPYAIIYTCVCELQLSSLDKMVNHLLNKLLRLEKPVSLLWIKCSFSSKKWHSLREKMWT